MRPSDIKCTIVHALAASDMPDQLHTHPGNLLSNPTTSTPATSYAPDQPLNCPDEAATQSLPHPTYLARPTHPTASYTLFYAPDGLFHARRPI